MRNLLSKFDEVDYSKLSQEEVLVKQIQRSVLREQLKLNLRNN